MTTQTALPDETARLYLLRSLALLDAPASPELDNITRLAARLFNLPVAGISLIDAERQWFKSAVGLDCREAPRRGGFCSPLLCQGAFAVSDARVDSRFDDCALVARPAGIVAYAACPLRSLGGHVLGAFFVADHQPRLFTSGDLELLASIAAYIELHFQKREVSCRAQALRHEVQEEAQPQLEQAFLQAAVGVGLASLEGRWLRVNPRLCHICGYSEAELLQLNRYDLLHPEDLVVDRAQLDALRAGCLHDYRMEKRLRHKKGHTVWVEASVAAVRNATGAPQFLVLTLQDINARKSREAAGWTVEPLARTA